MARTVDVDLVNSFWRAAQEALSTMAELKVGRTKVYVKKTHELEDSYYAVIGISNGLIGNCAVSMSEPTANCILEAMTGERGDHDFLMDGIGEIANLVTGGGKRHLAEEGQYYFDISTPTTLFSPPGKSTKIFNPGGTICIVIECEVLGQADTLPFSIELAFETEDSESLERRKSKDG